jgi:urease accessory protein
VEQAGPRTVVASLYAEPPLRLLVPRNHGNGVWCFTSHLGGGFVDGDRISLDVDVAEGAMALVGTQASTKVYRSPRGTAQEVRARVGDGGFLAVVPDPVVCFREARYEQRLSIELAPRAECIAVDAFTCGRTAFGERWVLDRYRSETRIRRAGTLLVHDAVELDAGHGDLLRRMARYDAFATVVVVGASAPDDAHRPVGRDADLLHQTSRLAVDIVVHRLAATRVEVLATALRTLVAPLLVRLGDDPFARKF